ncbi:MAG: hypothetical protein RLN75_06150 [Longimicrobiales bacterium]
MTQDSFRIVPLLAALATAACADGADEPAATFDPSDVAPPTVADLAGARVTLSTMDSLAVELDDGGAVAADGSRITLLAAYEARGDFDSDGAPETAALVVAEPGGTGVFTHLVAFRSGPDGPEQIADKLLGDRQQIHRFEPLADSLIVVITTQAPRDPMCCPTRRAEQAYVIRDGQWRLWRDNTLSAAPPDIQDGVVRRDSSLAQPGPVREGGSGG